MKYYKFFVYHIIKDPTNGLCDAGFIKTDGIKNKKLNTVILIKK